MIAAEFHEAWYRQDLSSIVGDKSADELATWISELCRTHLQQDVAGARFASKSVGAVFGVALASGEHVVLKVFPRSYSDEELRAIERCHAHVHAAHFPTPRQLGPIFRAGDIRVTFYELVDGEVLDAHDPQVRRTLATALARLTATLRPLDPTSLPLAPTRRESLWGPPHRITFDLARSGGEWIDERAREAKRIIESASLPVMCVHFDWSTKNALFRDGRLQAVLDWDSLVQASEAEAVGFAAAAFTAHGGVADVPSTPTRDEARAFVREYEHARGSLFSAVERRVINAAAEYLIAYVARQSFRGPEDDEDEYRSLLRATPAVSLIDEW